MEAFARLVAVQEEANQADQETSTMESGQLKLAVDNYFSCLQADIIRPELVEIEEQITQFEARLKSITDK